MSAYKVWYIPQVPMAAFEVEVPDVPSARMVLDALSAFSLFEFENRVKPDYSDAGGIAILDHGEWRDLEEYDEEFCDVCFAGPESSEHFKKCGAS